jgi:hypothetical protein
MKKFQINSKNLANSLLALSLMAGCVGLFGGSASAASVTDSYTPVSFDAPTSSQLTSLDSNVIEPTLLTGTSSYTIGVRNTGSLIFNPNLDAPYSPLAPSSDPDDSTTLEVARFKLPALSYVCSSTTPINITVGSLTAETTGVNDLPSDNPLAVSGGGVVLFNESTAPFMLSIENMGVYGNGHDALDATFTTTSFSSLVSFGDINSISILVLIETNNDYRVPPISYDGPGDQVSVTITSPPTIELTYDNSGCSTSTPLSPSTDISTTPSSTPVTINILGNDTGTGLSVSKIDNQTIAAGDTITLSNGSGTVKLNTDGTITFTPNSTFSGESIFSYSITDGASTIDTGVVRITVAAATTTTTTNTPSTPTASSASTNSTKVLAKTGEDVRLVAGGGMLVLVIGSYFIFKLRSAKMQY